MSNKLFVGNLSFNTTENDLQDAFAAHVTVVETNLMVDRASGRPRGFAFVTMSTDADAQNAITALNGAQLDGRALTVNIARPREERSGGGGGGGGRRFSGGGGPRRGAAWAARARSPAAKAMMARILMVSSPVAGCAAFLPALCAAR